MSDQIATAPGVVRVLKAALDRVHAGEVVGVTVISYDTNWGWDTNSAGSVLRAPAIGIAAAHLLASQLERRLRAGEAHVDRRA